MRCEEQRQSPLRSPVFKESCGLVPCLARVSGPLIAALRGRPHPFTHETPTNPLWSPPHTHTQALDHLHCWQGILQLRTKSVKETLNQQIYKGKV